MIPMHKVFMPDNIDEVMEPLRRVIESGWIGEGAKVLEFEKHISDYIGNAYVTALNSCTSALQLALRLCGVGIGDEVITTPMTCMATNEPPSSNSISAAFCCLKAARRRGTKLIG